MGWPVREHDRQEMGAEKHDIIGGRFRTLCAHP